MHPVEKCSEKNLWTSFCQIILHLNVFFVHYQSELWDHLFFNDCLNYLNFNSVSKENCSLNNVKAIKIIF